MTSRKKISYLPITDISPETDNILSYYDESLESYSPADLTPYCYHGIIYKNKLNIGWLGNGEFNKGSISPSILSLIEKKCSDCLINRMLGLYQCQYCGKEYGSGEIEINGNGVIYVAPELILHYISIHGYMPPSEFLESLQIQHKLVIPIINESETILLQKRIDLHLKAKWERMIVEGSKKLAQEIDKRILEDITHLMANGNTI